MKPLISINVESSTFSVCKNAQLFRKIWHWLKWCSVRIYFHYHYNYETFSFLQTEEKHPSETIIFSFNLLSLIYMHGKHNSWGLRYFINFSQIEGVFLRLTNYSILITCLFSKNRTSLSQPPHPPAFPVQLFKDKYFIQSMYCFQIYAFIRLIPIFTEPLSFDLTFIATKYQDLDLHFHCLGALYKFYNLGFM